MACARGFEPAPAAMAPPVVVTKHKRKGVDMTYINVRMEGAPPAGIARETAAQQEVSRSGNVVDEASDYYVGLTRLRFNLNVPLIIAPPFFDPTNNDEWDGIDTAWSLTVTYTGGATPYTGTARIRIAPQDRKASSVGLTSPPIDFSCSFPTLSTWRDQLNEAADRAFDACSAATAAGGDVFPATARAPFFAISDPGSGRMKLTMFPFSLWADVLEPTQEADLSLAVNYEAAPAFGGWDLFQGDSELNAPLPADGSFYIFNPQSDGYNYSPLNAAGAEALAPTAPTTTALVLQQTSPTFTVPGITRVSILASLPINPEFTPSESGKGSERILTDFSIDTSQYILGDNHDVFIYDAAGTAGTRWLKLMGGGSVTNFSIRIVTTDWQGTVRPFILRGPADVVDMKLCFAPNHVVEA